MKHLPAHYKKWNLHDPLRAAFITNPRHFVYRIYYNQATSSNDGKLKLVNWFDGNNLGLNTEPLLPDVKNVYQSFNGRHFVVPVIHVSPCCFHFLTQSSVFFKNPPWIFINNADNKSSTAIEEDLKERNSSTLDSFEVSGRDDTLLKILSKKMNFNFEYVDVMSLVEMEDYENVSQVSSLGLEMLKKRVRRKSYLLKKFMSQIF